MEYTNFVTLDSYIEELKIDTIVNELNLKEKSLSLPALKAKWVSIIISHRNKLNTLQRTKKKLLKDTIPQVKDKLPVKLSENYIKEKAEDVVSISNISEEIDREEKIIDFLEKVEKIMSSMTYDIGNIVKVVQLETL